MSKFLKSKPFWIIFAIIAIGLLILLISSFVKRGTYSIETGTNVALTCPSEAEAGSTFECTVTLNVASGDEINGISGIYNLPSTVSYSSFTPSYNCEDDDTKCISTFDSNGFVIGRVDNTYKETTELGKLKLTMSSTAQAGSTHAIGLKEISLSDNEFAAIDLTDVSVNIKVPSSTTPVNPSNNLVIDKTNKIIKRIVAGTTYQSLKDEDSSISTTQNDTAVIKTGDVVTMTVDGNQESYTLSVLGDLNKDGKVSLSDVTMAYRHSQKTVIITDNAVLAAGDVINDGKIAINDVTKIYRKNNGVISVLD